MENGDWFLFSFYSYSSCQTIQVVNRDLHWWLLSLFALLLFRRPGVFFLLTLILLDSCFTHALLQVFSENGLQTNLNACSCFKMLSRLILSFASVLYCKICGSRLHSCMLVVYHKCAGSTSMTNKYFLMLYISTAASVLVHRWRSSAVPGSGKPIMQRSNDYAYSARVLSSYYCFCYVIILLISLFKIPCIH